VGVELPVLRSADQVHLVQGAVRRV
jgi:hypothetical protein